MDHALTLGVGLAVLYPGEAIAGTAATLIAPGSWDVAWGLWGCALGAVAVGVALAASHRRGVALPRWSQWPVLIALLVGLAHVAPMSWGQASLAVAAPLWVAGWGATAKGWSLASAVAVSAPAFPASVDRMLTKQRRRLRRIIERRYKALILGEPGTGKNHLVRSVTAGMGRPEPVHVDCGTLPADLTMARSELFGHTRGAFNGARLAEGAIDRAAETSVFFDELGNLTPAHQQLVLQLTQDGWGPRVGDGARVELHGALIFATNADIPAMVEAGDFREDLWSRIRTARIELPPLRDWPASVRLDLAGYIAASEGVELCNEARALILDSAWQYNVRSLEEAIRFAAFISDEDGRLDLDALRDAATVDVVGRTSDNTDHDPPWLDDDQGAVAARVARIIAREPREVIDRLHATLTRVVAWAAGRELMAPGEGRWEVTPSEWRDVCDCSSSTTRRDVEECVSLGFIETSGKTSARRFHITRTGRHFASLTLRVS